VALVSAMRALEEAEFGASHIASQEGALTWSDFVRARSRWSKVETVGKSRTSRRVQADVVRIICVNRFGFIPMGVMEKMDAAGRQDKHGDTVVRHRDQVVMTGAGGGSGSR
jgi:hypothetical protein